MGLCCVAALSVCMVCSAASRTQQMMESPALPEKGVALPHPPPVPQSGSQAPVCMFGGGGNKSHGPSHFLFLPPPLRPRSTALQLLPSAVLDGGSVREQERREEEQEGAGQGDTGAIGVDRGRMFSLRNSGTKVLIHPLRCVNTATDGH